MAAGRTYTPIATTTLGADTASVTFSSISGSYTDLVLVLNGALVANGAVPSLQFNSDTGTNYSTTLLEGDGSTAISERLTNRPETYSGFSDGVWSTTLGQNTCIWHIQNYSNSTTYKSVLCRNNSVNGVNAPGVTATISLWRNTAAITTVVAKVNANQTNYKAGSTFTLYGIAAA